MTFFLHIQKSVAEPSGPKLWSALCWRTFLLVLLLSLPGISLAQHQWKPFRLVTTALPKVKNSKLDWADFDKDGRPDLMITGKTDSDQILSRLYHNTTDGFVDVSSQYLPDINSHQVSDGMVAWGDYDGDSWPDLLVTGDLGGGPHNYSLQLYHNKSGQLWDNVTSKLWSSNPLADSPPMVYGSANWVDFYKTGRLDLSMTGQRTFRDITGTHVDTYNFFSRNKGGGDFANYNGIQGVNLGGNRYSASAFADFDKDGYLDFVVMGETIKSGELQLDLYRNRVSNVAPSGYVVDLVTSRLPSTPGLRDGAVAWGDYDGDGWPDLIITGRDGDNNFHTYLYHNNAGKSFNDATALLPDVPQVAYSSLTWGDYDKDGRMDLLLTGAVLGTSLPVSRLYHSTPDGFEDTSDLLPSLDGVRNGSVAWVDYDSDGWLDLIVTGDSEGFATTQLYRNQGGYSLFEETSRVLPGLSGLYNSAVTWADYDSDGKLDLLLAGTKGQSTYGFENIGKLYHNVGGSFEDKTSLLPGLATLGASAMAWGDYDNDGKPDLMLTGQVNALTLVSKLYHNTGSGFEDKSNLLPGLPGLYEGVVAWVDYDSDGRLDLLINGASHVGGSPVSKLYRNTGSGFEDKSTLLPGLPGLYQGAVAWADYDRDGRPDLMITGNAGQAGIIAKLYHNIGNGFEEKSSLLSGLVGIYEGAVVWGDYDNDGWPDLLLTGSADRAYKTTITKLYHNTGQGFEETSAQLPNLPQVAHSSAAWGDYDNDGKLDLLLTGLTASGSAISSLYHNTGNGFETISLAGPDVPAVQFGSVSFGDYDNDGRLDFMLAGINDTGQFSKLYHNLSLAANTVPTAPGRLNSQVQPGGISVKLSWQAATDAQTPQSGLHYNLYVSDTPGGVNTLSPLANTSSGYRYVVQLGNSQTTTYTLTGLTAGKTYYWSVQAIDGAFAGSPFAAEQSFTLSLLGGAESELQLVAPLYNCQTGAFTFRTTGGDGSKIEYAAAGISPWTINPRQQVDFELRQATDAQPITLLARQNGKEVRLVWDIRAQCPVGDPARLRLVAPLYNCQTGAFTFKTAGGDGSLVEYMAAGITSWTTNPNHLLDDGLRTSADVKPLELRAKQGNIEVRYVWDIRAICPASSLERYCPCTGCCLGSARQGSVVEPGVVLKAEVYPNPVESELRVRIDGAQDQSVTLQLTNLSGQVVLERNLESIQSGHQEQLEVVDLHSGLYLLRVNNARQQVTLKVIKR